MAARQRFRHHLMQMQRTQYDLCTYIRARRVSRKRSQIERNPRWVLYHVRKALPLRRLTQHENRKLRVLTSPFPSSFSSSFLVSLLSPSPQASLFDGAAASPASPSPSCSYRCTSCHQVELHLYVSTSVRQCRDDGQEGQPGPQSIKIHFTSAQFL